MSLQIGGGISFFNFQLRDKKKTGSGQDPNIFKDISTASRTRKVYIYFRSVCIPTQEGMMLSQWSTAQSNWTHTGTNKWPISQVFEYFTVWCWDVVIAVLGHMQSEVVHTFIFLPASKWCHYWECQNFNPRAFIAMQVRVNTTRCLLPKGFIKCTLKIIHIHFFLPRPPKSSFCVKYIPLYDPINSGPQGFTSWAWCATI